MQQRGGSVMQPRFVIPAGAPAHEVRGSRVLAADTLITSFTPHMHVRGKDMTYIAKFPDGTDRDAAVGAAVRLQLADHLPAGQAAAVPEGHARSK